MSNDIVEQLRDRACPAGLPHTGDSPREDHGHTDCWLHNQAADEIERLRGIIAYTVETFDTYDETSESRRKWVVATELLRKVVE